MTGLLELITPVQLVFAFGIALLAGLIKGMVGFAMPMILISGLTLFLAPDLALAGLLLPTLATNVWQALRQGPSAAMSSVVRFRVFLIAMGICLLISAQLVMLLPVKTFLLMIGVPISIFALIQLFGLRFTLDKPRTWIETVIGGIAGFIGGLSGVWGPPTVLYLTALNTPKSDQVRIQGVIYGIGAVMLVSAHIGSGVLRWSTLPLSVALLVPALVGTWIGGKIHDRIDQDQFRKVTLAVLTIAGLNLVRRALMG
ncbi:sulfite exporter TauE/SafE family protein [Chachezhania antarctica]|uniref:sulfite exporter TauE/SafE family protein n=1 Tax=Chachezhania antarctica TaxID=2340860 RepID=UPI000EAB4AB8|nr:sulfite exporter TauE/SafE family protein [Chachezhania antarctica]|tara:strand:- start:559 stop:1326 length:768 start_codon:yes stop_codon:yes gene_type:complete